ncbi:Gfo/Idh/MocA family protein [Acidisphaera sp. S103]|uniref:Gfo/Idh/MocA family protein n=1 Tax=Acidisphaera sp. S103 TaxID=1747223 RepID=UPI00131D3325|nr:Gfo/Idh/MocA family oxidoreductase [Acidisphaera sp. S103]
MTSKSKIRVGIVGVNAGRGFASIAHVPALKALPDFEIVAVATTRQESADAAAKHYGARLAFADAAQLAAHPDVDLVTVCVKAPDHYAPVMAAIEAGKHVYCEWPLGRNTDEAVRMHAAADKAGVRHAIGLQGRVSPSISYVRDLIADGYIGRVLSGTMFVNAANWGATLGESYQADRNNGANLMTITGGHNLDALCYCLGEFRQLAAFVVSQRDKIALAGSGELITKTSPDQLVVSGIVGDGAAVSFQVRGGMARGLEFLFEIHGETGDLVLEATMRASTQRQELSVRGARGAGTPLAELPIPAQYRWVPDATPRESPYNVAQLYAALGTAIREGKPFVPGFDAAVTRHRMLDMITRASETGQTQIA